MSISELFHALQRTIEEQRAQMIRDGGKPNAVLLGPTAWRIADNYVLAQSRELGPEDRRLSDLSVPHISTIGALTIIRTESEHVTVVQTWEPPASPQAAVTESQGIKERVMQWYIKERLKAQDEAILDRKYTQEEDKELHEQVIANWGKNPVTKRS